MSALPQFLLGRHLTALTVSPVTQDTAGNITIGTALSVSGYIDGVKFISDPALEMVQSLDQTNANYETLYEDFSYEITEILRVKGGTNGSPVLPAVAAGNDLCQFNFTRGGQSYSCFGRRGQFTDGVSAFGKNACSLLVRPVTLWSGGTAISPVTFTS